MSKETKNIACPNCGHEINVNDLVYHQLSEQVQKEYSTKLGLLEKKEKQLAESIEQGVKKQLLAEKTKLEQKIRAEISSEKSEEIQSLEQQLDQKSQELKTMNKVKSELSQVKREKDELKEHIEAEAQERFNNLLKEEKSKIRTSVIQENELKIAEKDTMIETLNDQLKVMQRKLEQGSMQSQGEVMELAIEEYLRINFPLDTIDEVKKGARGADCLQIVNTRIRQNCGSLYFESKNTKEFQESWVEKFKQDMRLKNATIGAIVTEAMPKGMERLGLRDGIWICNYSEFKGLCFALRESVIMYSNAIATQENKGEKMVMLYDYLSSAEFQREITAIVEAFTQMNADLISEQRSMAMIWKKRQKQIDKVVQSTTHMVGSIRGIAGNSIATIEALELPLPQEPKA